MVKRMDVHVRSINPGDRGAVRRFLEAHAGSTVQARLGSVFDAADLPGFLAVRSSPEEPVGVATYELRDGACELCTLHTSPRLAGTGTQLVRHVADAARAAGAVRLWLITTNDNLDALRFYQRRGFELAALYRGHVTRARAELKPSIPDTGEFGIPIRDEIELELKL